MVIQGNEIPEQAWNTLVTACYEHLDRPDCDKKGDVGRVYILGIVTGIATALGITGENIKRAALDEASDAIRKAGRTPRY